MPELRSVCVSTKGLFQNGQPFFGTIRFKLCQCYIAADEYAVIPQEWQEVQFPQDGIACADLIPNSLLGEGSYYNFEISCNKNTGAYVYDRYGKKKCMSSGVVVVPDHDCNFVDIVTLAPTQPEPIEVAKAYASESKEAAVRAKASADRAEVDVAAEASRAIAAEGTLSQNIVSGDASTLAESKGYTESHANRTDNPHGVTAAQLGLSSAYVYMGSVATFADLPSGAGVENGHVYNVEEDGKNYAAVLNEGVITWDNLGGIIDLSDYALKTDVTAEITAAVLGSVKHDNTGNVVLGFENSAAGYYNLINGGNNKTIGIAFGCHAEGGTTEVAGQCSHSDGAFAFAKEDISYAWNGDTTNYSAALKYPSHGAGTYNINPVGGPNGLYIGDRTLIAIIDGEISSHAPTQATTSTLGLIKLAEGTQNGDKAAPVGVNANGQAGIQLASTGKSGAVRTSTDTVINDGAVIGRNSNGQIRVPKGTDSAFGAFKVSRSGTYNAPYGGTIGVTSDGNLRASAASTSEKGVVQLAANLETAGEVVPTAAQVKAGLNAVTLQTAFNNTPAPYGFKEMNIAGILDFTKYHLDRNQVNKLTFDDNTISMQSQGFNLTTNQYEVAQVGLGNGGGAAFNPVLGVGEYSQQGAPLSNKIFGFNGQNLVFKSTTADGEGVIAIDPPTPGENTTLVTKAQLDKNPQSLYQSVAVTDFSADCDVHLSDGIAMYAITSLQSRPPSSVIISFLTDGLTVPENEQGIPFMIKFDLMITMPNGTEVTWNESIKWLDGLVPDMIVQRCYFFTFTGILSGPLDNRVWTWVGKQNGSVVM